MSFFNYDFSEQRLSKRKELINAGINPYLNKGTRSHMIINILKKISMGDEVNVCGRITELKTLDNVNICIEDITGQIRIQYNSKCREDNEIILKNLDCGDFIHTKGVVAINNSEKYLIGTAIEILTKSVMDLPDAQEWENDKIRQRSERYIDLAIRNNAQKIFMTRVRLIRNIRQFLNKQDMYEVETPILRSYYDLCCQNQFETTDLNGQTLYLRICHEDRLKQLISGGFEKVYELGKSFRASDLSWKHSSEFLQLETIQAYSDYWDMMKHAEELYYEVTKETIGKTTFQGHKGDVIDLSPPWQKISVRDAIMKFSGIDIYEQNDADELQKKIIETFKKNNSDDYNSTKNILPPKPYSCWFWTLVDYCLDVFVVPNLVQPTILYDYPVDSNWLCKRKSDRYDYIERFEVFIDGIEIANCYTLVNDVVDYVERLESQRSWYFSVFGKESFPLDKSLIYAKAYGLPPMSESSFGIDRWLMLICEQESIQDVIWMPYPYI